MKTLITPRATLIRPLILSAAFWLMTCAAGYSGLILNLEQQGRDVVLSGSGTICTSGLEYLAASSMSSGINSGSGVFMIIGENRDAHSFTAITGPDSFGTGSLFWSDSSTGDTFGIVPDSLYLPADYQSGDSLQGTCTFLNQTTADLGLVEGRYTWTWGTGDTADFVELNVVPEPAAIMLLIAGACCVLLLRKLLGKDDDESCLNILPNV